MHLDCLAWDYVHVAPLGCMWDSNGATLHEICCSGHFGAFHALTRWHERLDAQCNAAYNAFKTWLHKQGLTQSTARFSHLTLSMKRKGSNPCLKSKGRAALHINAWLLDVCQTLQPTSVHDMRRASVLWAQNEIFDVYVKGDLILSDTDVNRLKLAQDALFNSLRGLRLEMQHSRKRAWHLQGNQYYFVMYNVVHADDGLACNACVTRMTHEMTEPSLCHSQMHNIMILIWLSCHLRPKAHSFLELIVWTIEWPLNAAFFWCWADESHVGQLGRASLKFHRSTAGSSMIRRFVNEMRVDLGDLYRGALYQ